MFTIFRARHLFQVFIFISVLLFASCSLGGEEPPNQTRVASENTQVGTQSTATPAIQSTPTTPLRRLTICLGAEPDTLYIYGGVSLAQSQILEAIYDGPIDMVGYQNHPVIL